jgi:hypothetical protein
MVVAGEKWINQGLIKAFQALAKGFLRLNSVSLFKPGLESSLSFFNKLPL